MDNQKLNCEGLLNIIQKLFMKKDMYLKYTSIKICMILLLKILTNIV